MGKTFATFDFAAVPTIRKAHVLALAESDAWLDQGANILCFGPSGTGKSHAAAAIGYALVERGKRVLFTRATDLVQRLQAARRDLALPALLAKLDKFDAVVLDDLGFARKDQVQAVSLSETGWLDGSHTWCAGGAGVRDDATKLAWDLAVLACWRPLA